MIKLGRIITSTNACPGRNIDIPSKTGVILKMYSQSVSKPTLDPSIYEPSLLWTVLNISYGLVLFVLFGWLNYQVALGQWPVFFKVIAMIPLTTLSAIGLYVLAALGHESLHGNLCKNAKLSFIC